MPCECSAGYGGETCNCYEDAVEAKKQIDQIEIQELILVKKKEAAKYTYQKYFQPNRNISSFAMSATSMLFGIFIGYKYKHRINNNYFLRKHFNSN